MIVSLDFETHYSREYSLSKMSEVEYILDPRFEPIMCAIKIGRNPSRVKVGRRAIVDAFAKIPWHQVAMLAHNTRFDGAILAWEFGIVPAFYLDTLSMARALTHANIGKSSLKAVSDYLGLPAKGEEVHAALGKTLADFMRGPLSELNAYMSYCARDNDNCYDIFQRFMRVFPKPELALIDSVLRMFIQPQVRLNSRVLAEHLNAVRAEKAACMSKVAHIDPAVFSSNKRFAELLESHGVEVPMKISLATGRDTYALAKGDREFKELCADETQTLEVQALLAARLGVKSTIEETRTAKMLHLSLRDWPEWRGKQKGLLAVPLRYYGAHTGRLSGDGGINLQNLQRKSRIREAIEAPPGCRIVHRDSSQIEARMVAFLARCRKLLDAFEQGRDVYSEFASSFYRMTVTKRDKLRRFVGKTSILGLGYGMGGPRFRHTLFIGNGGVSVAMDEKEALNLVHHYRREYQEIPALWNAAAGLLTHMTVVSMPQRFDRNFLRTIIKLPIPAIHATPEGIWLPNGMCIQYPNLREHRWIDDTGIPHTDVVYDNPYKVPKKLFGGKVVENVSQALARIVITNAAYRIKQRAKLVPFMTTHDSLDYCVPVEIAADVDAMLAEEFAIRPSWAPELPLASEGGFGRNLMIAEDEHHAEHNQ